MSFMPSSRLFSSPLPTPTPTLALSLLPSSLAKYDHYVARRPFRRSCCNCCPSIPCLPSICPRSVSTGRGGAGNIRAASRTRAAEFDEGEVAARENSRERSRDRGHTGGRGGAGNFRSQSRDPKARIAEQAEIKELSEAEKAAVSHRAEVEAHEVKSYGRGGA